MKFKQLIDITAVDYPNKKNRFRMIYLLLSHEFNKRIIIDFPLTGHKEVRYNEDEKKVVYEPVQLEQNYRNFDYESPWEGTKYIKEQTQNNDKKN